MSNKTTILLAGALLLRPVPAGAQTLISLRDAVMLAVRHDARVLDADAKAERARREADVTRLRQTLLQISADEEDIFMLRDRCYQTSPDRYGSGSRRSLADQRLAEQRRDSSSV